MKRKLKFCKYLFIIVLQFVVIQNLYGVRAIEGNTFPSRSPLFVGVNYQYGFTMNHNAAMAALNTKHFSTYELSLHRQIIKVPYWAQTFTCTAYGITFMYSELANPQHLGRLFGLYPYLDVPLFLWKNDNKICFTVGLGLAYGTKPYDRFDNYKNIAYGSHLNALVRLGLKGNVRIFPKMDLLGGFNLTHASNGTTKEPNYGLNNPAVFLGLNYQINNALRIRPDMYYISTRDFIVCDETPPKDPYILQIATYGGYKDTDFMTGTGVYFVGELNFNLLKQYRRFTGSWGAGFALSMDYAEIEMLKRKGEFSGSVGSYMIPSVKAIHQFHVGRLCIGTELAYMMYHKGRNKNVYANLIVGYNVNDWLTPGIVLRAGAFYADYIGIGLGCKVWKIK
jgi:hypothetical protein